MSTARSTLTFRQTRVIALLVALLGFLGAMALANTAQAAPSSVKAKAAHAAKIKKCQAVLRKGSKASVAAKRSCRRMIQHTGSSHHDGDITIVKDVNPEPDSTDVTFSTDGLGANFLLDDDSNNTLSNTKVFSNKNSGTYRVTELVPSGYKLADITCTGGGNDTSDLGATATIGLDRGENVVCTFTNEKSAALTIVKVTDPGNDSTDFTFNPSSNLNNNNDFKLDTDGPGALSDTKVFSDLSSGDYSVAEIVAPGYDLADITCAGGGNDTSDSGDTARIGLDAGENVVCTFTNKKSASLKIVKVTDPGNDSTDFTFNPSSNLNNNNDFKLDTDGPGFLSDSKLFSDLSPGDYTVAESVASGYDLADITCVGGGSNTSDSGTTATIGLDAGENVVCTFTNTKRGTVVIEKKTIGGNGTFSFAGTGSGITSPFTVATSNGSGSKTFAGIAPGQKSVVETVPAGWDLTALTCSDSDKDKGKGSSVNKATATATIDLDPGETVTCTFTNTKRGAVVIEKKTIGGNGTFSFAGTGSGITSPFTVATSNGSGSKTFAGIAPGAKTVVETVPAGWDLTALSCSDSDKAKGSSVNLATATATIDLDPGETVTCTYTNRKRGTIIVEKQTTPDGAVETFAFTGDAAGSIADNGTITVNNLLPGSYTSTEADPTPGFDLTSIVCNDGDSTGDIPTRTATFKLQAGETVKCVFTNTKRGTIIVEKQTNPDGAVETFAFTGDAAGTIADNGTITVNNLVPGGYTSTEADPTPGYDLTNIVCDDKDSTVDLQTRTATFKLQAGETVKCVFTNTKRGAIIVEKQTNPAGAAGPFSFTGDAAGSIADNGQITVLDLAPGTYTSTEADPTPSFDLTNIVCDDTDSTGDLQTRTATFELQAGETVKCVFTNTKRGSIKVVKQTLPDASQGSFEFDPSYAPNFSLGDGQDNTVNQLVPGTYTVAEIQQDIWKLTDITCTGEGNSYSGDGQQDAAFAMGDTLAQIDLAAGEDVTCTFTNTRRPDFVITKKATPNPAKYGQAISYTIEVSHIGENLPVDLSDYAVSDKFADTNVDVPLVREPGDDIGNDGKLSQGEVWSYGILGAQDVWGPVTRVADVCGNIVNTATIAEQAFVRPQDAQNPPIIDDPNNRFDTETVPVTCTPDLQVVKTGPAQVNFNDTITYQVAVSHAATSDGSPVPAAQVKVTDPKVTPNQLVLVSGDDGDAILEAAETWIYKVTANQAATLPATTCGSITNTAILAQVTGEVNLANNQSTATTNVICTLDIGIQKTSDKLSYDAGQTVTYTLTITNNGQAAIPFSQIVVSDPMFTPTLAAAAPAELAPGASLTYTGTKATTVANCAAGLSNTATVALVGNTTPETTTANNTATRAVTVVCPAAVLNSGGPVSTGTKLSIAKTGPAAATAGQLVTYRIKVTNKGRRDAKNVVIRDTLPGGLTLAGKVSGATFRSGTVTWKIGTLAPGKSKTVKVTVRIDRSIGGLRCNIGSARASNAGQVRDNACTRIRAVAGAIAPAVTG